MQVSLTLPVPRLVRHPHAHRRALPIAFAALIGCALTPVALTLLPLAAARTWRAGARLAAGVLMIEGLALGRDWINVASLAAYPATLTGPWITSLVAASVTAAAWGATNDRSAADILRVAAAVALVSAPWSPCPGLVLAASSLALSRWAAPSPSLHLSAANDNDPARPPLRGHHPPVSYPVSRSARSSAFD